ncbi:MAG: radical SAM protein [Desulfobacterales bacterium]|nr:MAG: radical SAM protein [Desulfobacterales bacterium]
MARDTFSEKQVSVSQFIKRHLTALRKPDFQSKTFRKRRWRLLQVESSLACNLRCIMCPWKATRRIAPGRGLLPPEIWESIRPHLPEVQSIDFTGGGEPLLQPHLAGWIAEAKAAGCETGFLTNGLLLQKHQLQGFLLAGVDWICVSMDGATKEMHESIRIGSDFDRVCENVAQIAALRRRRAPKTMINFVLMEMNFHQVEEIIRLAARLGVDQVNYKQCDVIRGEHGQDLGLFDVQETQAIRRLQKALEKARRLARRLNVQTTAFAFTPEEQPVCEQDPRNSLFVRHDGAVAPCINLAIGGPTTFLGQSVNMPTVHFGRLPEDDLLNLWETATCRFYRERFQQRVQAHEKSLMKSLIGSSSNRLKILQAAQKAMPDAPQGCDVCHYLYDI